MAVHKKNKTLEPKERDSAGNVSKQAQPTRQSTSAPKSPKAKKASSSDRKKSAPAWNPEKRRLKSA